MRLGRVRAGEKKRMLGVVTEDQPMPREVKCAGQQMVDITQQCLQVAVQRHRLDERTNSVLVLEMVSKDTPLPPLDTFTSK
jgi:hypothetical protein